MKNLLQKYITERANKTLDDLDKIQNSARAPFAYCSKLINEMRQIIRVGIIPYFRYFFHKLNQNRSQSTSIVVINDSNDNLSDIGY